jgi:hypothetical protein
MVVPFAPWAVRVTPDWLSTPRGSGAVPVPSRLTRSSSTVICPANDLAMTSSLDGSASSNSSTDRVMSRTRVRAVKVTRSKTMSAALMAAFSVFQAGVPSDVSRARARVCDCMGTVSAPAWKTRVAFRARSMTRAPSGAGTSAPPAPTVASASARSLGASVQSAVAMPRR